MKLVITQNITVDGVVEVNEETGDWFSVSADDGNDDLNDAIRQMMIEEDGFLVGRRTFEQMRGYWPHQTEDTTGVTDHLNEVEKFVVSSTLTDPEWAPTTVLGGDPVDEVARLKQRPESVVGVTGSIQLCHALIPAGLVDEYRLFVYPVVVGTGRRLFDGDAIDLELVDTRAFRSGVRLDIYRPRNT